MQVPWVGESELDWQPRRKIWHSTTVNMFRQTPSGYITLRSSGGDFGAALGALPRRGGIGIGKSAIRPSGSPSDGVPNIDGPRDFKLGGPMPVLDMPAFPVTAATSSFGMPLPAIVNGIGWL